MSAGNNFLACEGGNLKETQVAIGAKHPVIGMLYLQVIPDGEVGLVDIYRVTDSISGGFLEVYSHNWRLYKPEFYRDKNRPWHETVIEQHISMIRWYEDKEVSRICAKHDVSCEALQQWAADVHIWRDVPLTSPELARSPIF